MALRMPALRDLAAVQSVEQDATCAGIANMSGCDMHCAVVHAATTRTGNRLWVVEDIGAPVCDSSGSRRGKRKENFLSL